VLRLKLSIENGIRFHWSKVKLEALKQNLKKLTEENGTRFHTSEI